MFQFASRNQFNTLRGEDEAEDGVADGAETEENPEGETRDEETGEEGNNASDEGKAVALGIFSLPLLLVPRFIVAILPVLQTIVVGANNVVSLIAITMFCRVGVAI